MAAENRKTTDHDEIRRWVEGHDGIPTTLQGTTEAGANVPAISFPSVGEDPLNHIDWEEWFVRFEQHSLAFLYQPGAPPPSGIPFYQLVQR